MKRISGGTRVCLQPKTVCMLASKSRNAAMPCNAIKNGVVLHVPSSETGITRIESPGVKNIRAFCF